MAITIITTQPPVNALKACMRPIIFEVRSATTVPIAYCDVYINSVYIGTYEHSVPKQKTGLYLLWQFDIREKVQEFFVSSKPAGNGGSSITPAGASCKVFCKFRDSQLVDNILTPEGPEPILGTPTQPPTPGGGLSSNSIWVMYATQQHESNPVLETHLRNFIRGSWRPDAYPLTHRPLNGYQVVPGYTDFFPFAVKAEVTFGKIRLHYRRKLAVSWQQADYTIPPPPPTCDATVIGITETIDLVAGTNTITPLLDGATEYQWSMPEKDSGALQGPVAAGASFTTPALTLDAYYFVVITPRCSNGVNGTPYTHYFQMKERKKLWRGRVSDAYCQDNGSGDNTGYLVYQTLEEYYIDNGSLTGNTKTNAPGDPDYVPPVYDLSSCQLPAPPGGGTMIGVGFGLDEADACASSSFITFVSPVYGDVATGATLYQDSAMTNPYTGYLIAKRSDGVLFFVDSTTGIVGSPTGNIC